MITVMLSKNNLQDTLSLSYSIPKTPPKPSLGNNGIPYIIGQQIISENFPSFLSHISYQRLATLKTKSNFRILVANTILGIAERRMS